MQRIPRERLTRARIIIPVVSALLVTAIVFGVYTYAIDMPASKRFLSAIMLGVAFGSTVRIILRNRFIRE